MHQNWICVALTTLALLTQSAMGALIPACDPASTTTQGSSDRKQNLAEEGFWPIGGQEQWVTVHGEDCQNPAILVIHGGPGNPLSPFSQAMYRPWTKHFTIVQWDQRGTGKTFGRNPGTANATLTLDQMVNDGIAVAELLRQRLGHKKVILMGSSWGSILSVHMAHRRPDLFHAYVGTAQMVSYTANQAASYAQTLALARAADDKKTVVALEAIGPPPRTDPRAFGVLRRAIRAYEGKATTPAPRAWWQAEAQYTTPAALEANEQGEDYSFLQFVGLKGDGMFSKVDLPALGLRFDLPVYLVQGQEDLLTPLSVTHTYFDSLQAPDKAMVVVAQVGHDPNEPMLAAQYKILVERVVPRTRDTR